mmetsp:Transcript_118479/g.342581  ORF Transcript_118479/g.342581 Transcript_118479/m.342581 type:complete len:385 (-) Transcript_118479:522-1676(-)
MRFEFGVSDYFTTDAVAAACFGGLVVGSTVAFKTGVIGEVLGVSGSTRGMLIKPALGKAAFILGLVVAGIFMPHALGGTEALPAPVLDSDSGMRARIYVRLGVGGALVGFGTALGNGCTSGHGLTGLARLSLRSWVAVPLFMFFAMLTATLSGTADAFPAQPVAESEAPRWDMSLVWAACIIAFLLLCAAAAHVVGRTLSREAAQKVEVAAEFVAGVAFGCGLCVSSMVRPSKVAGFLDWRSGAWDPSLAFVMGGGLAVTFPFWQLLERKGPSSALLGGGFGMPARTKPVDRDLVLGAMLFGIGWGVCGVCPGPIWVLVGAEPSGEVAVVVVGLLLGMLAWRLLQKYRGAGACAAQPTAPEAAKETPEAPGKASAEKKAAAAPV